MNPNPDITEHPARILVVDDDLRDRQLMEIMLAPEGYHLSTAASGDEALAMVAQQPPDLILLDIMMPGMDGYEVAGKIKGNLATKNIPIITITALDDRNARMLGLSAGAEDFLTKPVDRAELCVRVRNLLRLKAYGDYYGEYSQMLEGEVGSRTIDLVERTKTLEQQAAVLREQAALLDLAQDAIVVRDMQCRIVFWSRGAEVMYGWLSTDVLGRHSGELLKTEFPQPHEQIEATLLREGQWEGEFTHHKRDGTRVFVASRWALQRDASGVPFRVLTINNDITDRKQADSELLQLTERLSLATAVAKVGAEAARVASEAKSNFLATMSHEIRTPMNGIIGMTELVLDTELTDEAREHLDMVKTSAGALLDIINDILDFSKIEAGKLDLEPLEFDLRNSIGTTLKALALRAHSKGLELVCRIDAAVPEVVIGDDGRLRQIVTNLVGNAIKFTEQGDVSIHVRTEAEGTRDGTVMLHFAVSDTGIGIPEHRRTAVFNSFEQADSSTTRKYGGTGLGLAISANLAQAMGGRMWVESEFGSGSTFHFTIQLRSTTTPLGRAAHAEPIALRGMKVLLVDDREVSRSMLHEMFLAWAMRPAVVASAVLALDAMRDARDAGMPFALAVIDAEMPHMDGFALVERMRADPTLAGGAILMLQAGREAANTARCRELEIPYVNKPVTQSDLLAVIIALEKPRRTGSARAPITPAPTTNGRRLSVLLAEDNVINQRLAIRLFEKRGHQVVVVTTGREALAATEDRPFDVVLMDVQMPDMDGLKATAAIRARERTTGGRVPIVAMTANALKGDRERCLAAGMDAYVSKPIQPAILFTALEELLFAQAGNGKSASAPTTAAVTAGPVDIAALREFADGDENLVRELTDVFLHTSHTLLTAMRDAIARGDAQALEHAAHSIRGSAGVVAARDACERAQRLELMGSTNDLAGAPTLCAELEREMARVEAALRGLREDAPTTVNAPTSA